MKRFPRLGIALLAAVAALALPRVGLAADYTLNVNTALTTDDPLYKGLEIFKQKVEAGTSGKLEVRLFPSSQLGKDEDVLEQARAGGNVAVVVDGGRLAVFTKEFGILGAPFLAQGFDGIRKVSREDIRRVARQYLVRDQRTVATLIPTKEKPQ